MIITKAKYKKDLFSETNSSIEATVNEEILQIPLDTGNRHYAEILKQVADGIITIAEAD